MKSIKKLYLNSGLITEDDYVKVRDRLWIKSGPYKRQSWDYEDESILPTKEESYEIYLKVQELIQIQEACKLKSLKRISIDDYPLVWSSTEYNSYVIWTQNLSDGFQGTVNKKGYGWVVPVRRTP